MAARPYQSLDVIGRKLRDAMKGIIELPLPKEFESLLEQLETVHAPKAEHEVSALLEELGELKQKGLLLELTNAAGVTSEGNKLLDRMRDLVARLKSAKRSPDEPISD
jgi:hypothetical protein